MASGDAVQQIKDRLSIVDVISLYVELHPAGKNLKGKSPFTNEKTPSFYVSPDRGMYYCFSSSQGGDMFTFVEKMEGVDFKGALKILAEKANVELVPEDPKKRSERDTKYHILEEATKYYIDELAKNKEAKVYLQDRGVTEKTITNWQIGYAPGPPKFGWRHVRDHLLELGFKDSELMSVGLVKSSGEGKAPYDTFRDRIMFPIRDVSGRVVAYSGRILTKDNDAPKYVNSPETELFNKSEILFGYDKAKEGIRKLDFSLIVEGQFDVVLAHQAGYNNTVAVSGTALTPHHVGLLQRLSNRVVLALDADRAGIAAVKRAADLMLSRGIDLKVAELPEGKDPADLIKEGKDEFKKVIGQSMHVVEFLLHVLLREEKDERKRKLRLVDEVLPYIVKLNSHIDRDHFIDVTAKAVQVGKEAIALDVNRLEATIAKQAEKSVTNEADNREEVISEKKDSRKQAVLTQLICSLDLIGDKENQVVKKIVEELLEKPVSTIKAELPPESVSRLVFTLENDLNEVKLKQLHEELCDRLNELRTILVKEKISQSKQQLLQAEKVGDDKQIETHLKDLSDLQKQLTSPPYQPDMFTG